MNEKEYKMYVRALKALERVKDKPIPKSCERDVKRRKELLDNFKGLGI